MRSGWCDSAGVGRHRRRAIDQNDPRDPGGITMISPAVGLRIYVASKPVDFRNYVEPMIMRSGRDRTSVYQGGSIESLHIVLPRLTSLSIARTLSGARNRPGLSFGNFIAPSASSFSVGSARR